jgi:hypothetical protein
METTAYQFKITDEEMGRLIRYISKYKTGGFQNLMRTIFARSFPQAQ